MNVSFGIIGCGGIARKFADALNRTAGVTLYAVAARDQARANAFAELFSATKAYGNYQDLMNDENVDIIYVAVTHNAHYDVVKECLLHKKNVICEKPMVMTKAEAEDLYRLAKENDVMLVEAMWTRTVPVYQKMKEWIREGRIGQLKMINADLCVYFPFDPEHRLYNPELGGGALYDLGVYGVEFLIGIADAAPVSIGSNVAICETGVDETTAITMLFPNNVVGKTICSSSTVGHCAGEIYGTAGYIEFPVFFDPQVCRLYNSQKELIEEFVCPCENGFIYQVEHVRDLFLAGKKESDLIPMCDTILTAGIFDQVLKA